nr:MAG TPA: minor tail protein [Caudoviricetes sp.]
MADNVEIQGLEFQIVNDSTQAVAGLQNLINTLNRLKTATNGGATGLSKTAQGIRELSNSLKGLNSGDASQKITRLTNALTALSRVGNVKISSSIANQLTAINTALAGLKWTDGDKLTSLANGLRPLSELGKANMTTFINQLSKLPKVIEDLETADIDKFTQQMNDLAVAMKPFADEMQKVSAGFSSFPSRIQRVITSSAQYNNAMQNARTQTNGLGLAIKGLKFSAIAYVFRKVASFLGYAITKAGEYQEDLNLFTVSMSEYAKEAYRYAQQVSEVMGIDPAEWMRNQGVFNTIISGFGVVGDKAAFMSKNLTQLGYDIASFYNISFSDAMQKVQSGIAGELEPLRRLGYDLSVARLQQEALNLGITKSVSAMTQAEKAQLRYYAMMTQVTQVQGDMARTLENPTNMLRVLKAQLEQVARAIGNLFIPILTKVLPVLIAFAKALREIIAAIAALFGVTLKEPEWKNGFSNAAMDSGNIADNLSDATNSAKELKRYLAGFDELNVLPDQTKSASGGGLGGIGGGDLGIDLPGYDFLANAVSKNIDMWQKKLEPFVTWVKDNLKQILITAGLIGAAFLGWKVSQSFIAAIEAIKSLSALGSFFGGITLSLAGFSLELTGLNDAIKNGLSGLDFGTIVGGGLLGTGGTALLGKAIGQFIAKAFKDGAVAKAITAGGGAISTGLIGAAIGGIVAGIPMFVAGAYDAIKNGLNWLNGLLVPIGSTMAGAGIGAIIGMLGGPIGAGIGALVGVVVGAITDLIALIVNKWDEIKVFFAGIADWFDKNVVQPVVDVFAPIVGWISEFFRGCWIIVQAVWQVASEWFNTKVVQPIVGFFRGVWTNVSAFFTNLWDDIATEWAPVAEWFNTNVIQPITKFFSDAWGNIKYAFQAAFTAIGNFAVSVFNGVIGRVETMVNRIIGAINGLISGFNRVVSWAANIIGASWSGLSLIPTVSLPRLADGGFVDEGQLFIAREAGAEMVGSIGRRTAVANNDQIVEGITYGVREANDDVVTAIYAVAQQIIGAMREQNGGNGSFDLGAYIARQQRETARMNG